MIAKIYMRTQQKRTQPALLSAILLSLALAFIGALLGFVLFARNAPLAMNNHSELHRMLAQSAERNTINPSAAWYLRPPTQRPLRWQDIRTQIETAQGEVVIPTADVNGWLQAIITPPPLADMPSPGFAIRQIQLATPGSNQLQWTVSGDLLLFGQVLPVLYIFEGSLADAKTPGTFKIEHLRINAAPVPALLGLRQWFARSLITPSRHSSDYILVRSALDKVTSINSTAEAVILRFP